MSFSKSHSKKNTGKNAPIVQKKAPQRESAAHSAELVQELQTDPRQLQPQQILQLQRLVGNQAVQSHLIQRWDNLGTESWQVPPLGGRHATVWVGTKEEWISVLDDMDNEESYNSRLRGFLEVSNSPSIVDRTEAPRFIGNVPYENTITRAPNNAEKLAFLQALYEMGGNLDLWRGGFNEGGPYAHSAEAELSKFIGSFQGLYIADVSSRGEVIDSGGVRAVSDQGGSKPTMAMIINAGATAHKGVDLVKTANEQEGQERETAHAAAMETIRNSGRIIRETLAAHDGRVAFQQAIVNQAFDTVWGMIPAGGTLVAAGMGLLKTGLAEGLKNAQAESGPTEQAEKINSEFVKSCNELVQSGYITSADAQDAINGFEAVRR